MFSLRYLSNFLTLSHFGLDDAKPNQAALREKGPGKGRNPTQATPQKDPNLGKWSSSEETTIFPYVPLTFPLRSIVGAILEK